MVSIDDVQKMNGLLANDQYRLPPIIVDSNSKVIIDGHHRYELIKSKGYEYAPCVLIDYQEPLILALKKNIQGEKLDKKKIIEGAIAGKLLPQKFTFHVIKIDEQAIFHLSKFNPKIDVNLLYEIMK